MICTILNKTFKIPKYVSDCAILQKSILYKKYKNKTIINSVVIKIIIFRDIFILLFYCLIGCLLFFKNKKKNIKIIFDNWFPESNAIYKVIISKLNIKNFGFLCKKKQFDQNTKNSVTYSKIPPRQICIKVLHSVCLYFYNLILIKKKLNFFQIFIFIRILYEIIRWSSEVKNLRCKIFISSHDNGFTPLKYWVYKNNCQSKIILLQSGARVELNMPEWNFIFADAFFCWSKKRFFLSKKIHATNVYETGSLLLQTARTNFKKKYKNIIIFIEQVFHPKKEATKKSYYHKFFKIFLKFCKKYKHQRFVFITRPFEEDPYVKKMILDSRLPNLEVLPNNNNVFQSYKKLLECSVCVGFDSSMRWEALVLGKPVLTGFSSKNDFIYKNTPNIMRLNKISFKEFQFKLNKLQKLSSSTKKMRYMASVQKPFIPNEKFVPCLKREIKT